MTDGGKLPVGSDKVVGFDCVAPFEIQEQKSLSSYEITSPVYITRLMERKKWSEMLK
jgi:hypothetical protein